MKLSLDSRHDFSNKELISFLSEAAVPEYVKTAHVATFEDVATLDKTAFADQYNNAFPIDTPANTYVSWAFFMNKKADLDKRWGKGYTSEVEDNFNKAGELHKVSQDLSEYTKHLHSKQAKDYTVKHIYTIKVADVSEDLFPVKTTQDFTKQAEVLNNSFSNLPFSDRVSAAKAFVKQAGDYGVDELPDLLCKYAGLYFPERNVVSAEMYRRVNKISDDETVLKYASLIEKNLPACQSIDDFLKLSEEVNKLECESGVVFDSKVAIDLGDFVDNCFLLPIDKVAYLMNVVDIQGHKFNFEDLQKVSSDVYKEAFGIEIDPKNASDLRDVLPTMPLSDVPLFMELSGLSTI